MKIIHTITVQIVPILLFTLFIIPFSVLALDPKDVTSKMIFEMEGDLQFYVTQPNGEKTGSWRMESDLETDNLIDFSIGSKYQALVLGNPTAGTYLVETDYRFPGMASSEFTITYLNPQDKTYARYHGRIATDHNQRDQLSFKLFPTNTDVTVQPHAQFNSITDLAVYPTDNNTTYMQWSPYPEATSYRIYKKQFNADLDYVLLAETNDTHYQTDVIWGTVDLAPGVVSKYTEFAVTAILPDGRESFFSNSAYNNDSDQDGFSDEEELEIGTNPLLVDTDGDSLNDFYEVNIHYTDPLKMDTDSDDFSDEIEIQAGTSPLDPNFFPSTDCQNLGDEHWYISSDCDIKQDITAQGDIIIGNKSTLNIKEKVTLWFNHMQNKILVMVGSTLNLEPEAQIKQSH